MGTNRQGRVETGSWETTGNDGAAGADESGATPTGVRSDGSHGAGKRHRETGVSVNGGVIGNGAPRRLGENRAATRHRPPGLRARRAM